MNHPKETFKGFYNYLAEQNTSSYKGHGFDHDVIVASIARLIAPNERLALLSWIAAMLHSFDHTTGGASSVTGGDKNVLITNKVKESLKKLPEGFLSDEEEGVILDAVLRHWEKSPHPYTEVLQILREADMIANLSLDAVIRGGQYRPNIPPVELAHITSLNPESTYLDPKSVLDAIRISITEYSTKITLPKALPFAEKRIKALGDYITQLEESYKDIGLT